MELGMSVGQCPLFSPKELTSPSRGNARSAANTTFFGAYRRTCSSVHPIYGALMPQARTYYVRRGGPFGHILLWRGGLGTVGGRVGERLGQGKSNRHFVHDICSNLVAPRLEAQHQALIANHVDQARHALGIEVNVLDHGARERRER